MFSFGDSPRQKQLSSFCKTLLLSLQTSKREVQVNVMTLTSISIKLHEFTPVGKRAQMLQRSFIYK